MAGEVLVKLSRSAVIAGRTIGGVDELIAADTHAGFKQTVPTGTTDYEVDLPVTVANIYVSAIHSSQNVTLVTNIPSTSTATTAHQTIAVTKNVAQIYTKNEPSTARTFTTDIVKMYISNSSGFDALVDVGFGLQQAPTGTA